jgi:hypothetical protein
MMALKIVFFFEKKAETMSMKDVEHCKTVQVFFFLVVVVVIKHFFPRSSSNPVAAPFFSPSLGDKVNTTPKTRLL